MDGSEGRAEFTINPRGGEQLRPRVVVDGSPWALRRLGGRRGPQRQFQIHARGVDRFEEPFLNDTDREPVWRGQQRPAGGGLPLRPLCAPERTGTVMSL